MLTFSRLAQGTAAAPSSRVRTRANYTGAIKRAGALGLELELTRKVLEVRRLRERSSAGAWPVRVAGIERSSCPDVRWVYEVDASGVMRLSLERADDPTWRTGWRGDGVQSWVPPRHEEPS